jgi:transposase
MVSAIRADYSQGLILPPYVDEWVPDGHPVRFIGDFVDHLDLRALGFQVLDAAEGRPAYAADLCLKVLLYGFFSKVRSFRGLERACQENLGMMYLTGGHRPDHNTLWRFWKVNRDQFKKVFQDLVFVARRSNLVGFVTHAVDGTKIPAQVAGRSAWHADELKKELGEIERKVEAAIAEFEAARGEEAGALLPEELRSAQARQKVIEASLQELEEVKRKHLHPADKDARMMKMPGRIALGYNAQVVADEASGLIVAEEVVRSENDREQLVPMIEAAVENVGSAAETTLADAGYCTAEQLAQAEERGHGVLVSVGRPGKSAFHKARFAHDAEKDVVVCPKGEVLTYEGDRKWADRTQVRKYRCHSGATCECREQCSRDRHGRCVDIGPHDWAVSRQRALLAEGDNRAHLKRRGAIVEWVFALIKEHMGFRRFTVRGQAKVRAQWSLMCTAFNLKRLYRHWVCGALAMG